MNLDEIQSFYEQVLKKNVEDNGQCSEMEAERLGMLVLKMQEVINTIALENYDVLGWEPLQERLEQTDEVQKVR